MRVAVYDARGTRSTRTDAGLLEPSASSPLTLDNVPLAPLKLQLSFPHSVQSRLLRPASLPMLRMPTSFKRISRDSAPETAADDHGRSATSYWDYPSDSFRGIKLFGGGNPPGSLPGLYDRPSRKPPLDDRSGWAKWNSSIWGVSTTIIGFLGTMVVGFTLLPSDVTTWERPEYDGLKGNFTSGPRFDNDRIIFNYIMHPIGGSELYMTARNRDLTWWQSLAYAAAISTTFEFFIESAYERASWQDLWITPVSGAVLGELRWQVKRSLEDPTTGKPNGTLNKILYVVIDPCNAVYQL
ncbi:MAG: DUF3943 domain-containing protein [Myxococcales bacterium]